MASSSGVVEVEEEEGAIATTPTENIPYERQDGRIADAETITDQHYTDNTSRRRSNPFMVAHGGSVQIVGNLTDTQLNFYGTQSLFRSLAVQPHDNVTANDIVSKASLKV
jgi:hypothetical protein